MRTDWTTPPQTNLAETRTATARKVGISRRSTRPAPHAASRHPSTRQSGEPVGAPVAEVKNGVPGETPPASTGQAKGAARPASGGAVLYTGRFAEYTWASLFRLEGVDMEQAAALDRTMVELGFQHLGDLHTSRTGSAVFRVYGQPESSVYAILLKSGPRGGYEPELYTAFADGASLTTSIACRSGLSQDRKRKTLRLGAQGDLSERLSAHIEMVWQLSQAHGEARAAEPSLAAFAVTLDELLLRVRE